MIKLSLFLFILFPSLCFALPALKINFPISKVNQGSLQKATIILDELSAQAIELQKLKGQTLGSTVYLYALSPVMRKDGGNSFEAEATVIFAKVPEATSFTHKMDTIDILVSLSEVEVIPTEAPKEFLFGQFEVPTRVQLLTWLGIFLLVAFSAVGGWKFFRKLRLKKAEKRRKTNLKNEIYHAKNFSEVVFVWQKKHSFIKEFPHIEIPLKELEKVLFKYQFKPQQSETEKAEVLKAYNEFLSRIDGGFNGI